MRLKSGFTLALLLAGILSVWAQTFSRQGLSFTLLDKDGTILTKEALISGKIKVYSLRETKVTRNQQLVFNPQLNRFTFSESAASPGISLAFISPTDTMFLSVFGRSGTNRVIDGVQIRKGSYLLTSNEFGGKYLKADNWDKYLENELEADKQDLRSYIHALKDKMPVTLVEETNN